MHPGLVTAAYIAAAVLFILALGGLSNQEKAKRAIWYGIIGMALAVLATILGPGVSATWLILLMILIGGGGGAVVAQRVQMTQMPELVAGFHSLVGLAAASSFGRLCVVKNNAPGCHILSVGSGIAWYHSNDEPYPFPTQFTVERIPPGTPYRWYLAGGASWRHNWVVLGINDFRGSGAPGRTTFVVLWPFGVLASTVGAFLCRRWAWRVTRPTNSCLGCGYARVGLPNGHKCPECGAE